MWVEKGRSVRKKKNMEAVVNNFEKDIKIASNVELVKH
jgi:hypothetical protein